MSEEARDLGEPGLPVLAQALAKESGGLSDEGSLLDALAQERQDAIEKRECDLPVAGFSQIKLYARYRLLEGIELGRIGQKVTKEFKTTYDRNLYGSIDVIIAACEGFFVDVAGDGTLQPLTHGGVPVTGYNSELAAALRFTDSIDAKYPARSIVLALFGGNEVALVQHNMVLGRWMGNTSLDVNQAFLDLEGNL